MTALMNITEKAANRIKHLLGQSKAEALSITVKSGGCSGFKYDIQLLDKISNAPEKSAIITENDVTVVVDNMSMFYLLGTTLDYEEGLLESKFKFINPNEKSSCGCGESFSV